MRTTLDEVEVLAPSLSRARIPVPMRDGVPLATDVYWDGGLELGELGPAPVLLERSPYDVRVTRPSDGRHVDGAQVTPESGAAFFVDRGYVVVRQDCRGRGGSPGRFSKYTGEAEDGYDTHAWLAAQPWCDGTIVTHGVSYSAHTQAAAASVGAGPWSAMVLDSGGFSDAWQSGGRLGGAFELKQVMWALRRASVGAEMGASGAAVSMDPAELDRWFRAMPWRKGYSPLSVVPEYEDFVFEQWSHEDFDAFWSQPGLYARGHYDAFPRVPVLSISSWYDPYVFTAVDNYRAARDRGLGATLVLGPWTHGARSVTYAGDVDFGSKATLDGNLAPDYLTFKADWFERALATDSNGSGSRPGGVHYFVMGGGSGRWIDGRLDHGGHWEEAPDWPPPGAHPWSLYPSLSGGLVEVPPDPGRIDYDFDPRDPAPSRGGGITSGEPLMSGGAFDQVADGLPLAARPDVVSFQTEPLDRAVTVAGEVRMQVDFSSSAPDTDLVVTLVDVHPATADDPTGFAMNVTDHLLRLRYRDSPANPVLMEPGQVYPVTVVLPDTANRFEVGHRIRVDLTSSNFPRCDVNPNTGDPVMGARTRTVARNTIHIGGSRLVLSVLDPQ